MKIDIENKELLLKIWDNNEELQANVENDYMENEMFWIGEYLNCIKNGLRDWNIGFYNRNYIVIGDINTFIGGIEDLQNDYNFFNDNDFNNVNNLIENYYDDKIDHDDFIATLENITISQFNTLLEIENKYLLDYFLGFYIHERMDIKNMYVDNNYILYENIQYVKSYK